jgi:putative ABC transport system ATP-binding protein
MSESLMVQASGLHRHFGHDDAMVRAVDGVDLEVAPGEMVAIVGPSGCGKSTLLHLLGGLDRPTAGEVHIAGHRVTGTREHALARLRRMDVGFVFQAFHLLDELTAVENIEVPALIAGVAAGAARRRALELLEQVGLSDRAGHLPASLSGGQRQRVAVARALVNRPHVVLADEPTGNLDSAASADLLRLFAQVHDAGHTLVIVTHDQRVAATTDRLVSMRDGRVVNDARLDAGHQAGTWTGPADLLAPLFVPAPDEA